MSSTSPEPWVAARDAARQGLGRLRSGTRGLLLPAFTWPLLPDLIFEIAWGDTRAVVAAALGLGLPWLAVRKLRRGRAGGIQAAALLMAGATGIVSAMGAGHPAPLAVLLAAGAWLGTRLLYDGAVEEVPEPAPPSPPGPLEEALSRLSRLRAAPVTHADPRLSSVTDAMAGVLEDLAARPERLPQARRFLTVHLDGLERITDRLSAGAEPPPGLPGLLDELREAAEELRLRLRAEESEALEIQVKVLSDRLRQEGYA
jgi:hypothetical protein